METKDKDKDKSRSSDVVVKSRDKEATCWLGFDLGGTKMLATAFDKNFKQLGRERKKTKGHEGADVVVSRIIETIKAALDDADLDKDQLAGIGIGCPGPIDTRKGVVIEAPNLNWKDVPIQKILKQEFKKDVVLCNDVDAGVFGEYTFGSAKGASCAVGIFPGTGVGGGCVFDGKIFQGRVRSCMEIGHIPIVSDSNLDGAGNAGTVESVASRLAISSALAQASFRGQVPYINRKVGTDLGLIRSGVIADALANENGGTIKKILQQACEHLCLAIVTLIHLMSPDKIVLGGGLVEAMPDFFLKQLEDKVGKRILQSFADTYEICIAELGDDAAVMGAAAWAKRVINA